MSILLRRRNQTISLDNLPKYVRLRNSCLRLTESEGRAGYWRDGGAWGCGFRIENGKLYCTSNMDHLNGSELIPISKEEWKTCNGEYAPI